MQDVELITNRFLSKEYLENLFKRNGWSSHEDIIDRFHSLLVSNKKGRPALDIALNKQDKNGNEVYDEDLDPESVEETKKDPRFSKFTPYYTLISYYSDSYDDVVDFFYMLKKDGLCVFYRFDCTEEMMKELKN